MSFFRRLSPLASASLIFVLFVTAVSVTVLAQQGDVVLKTRIDYPFSGLKKCNSIDTCFNKAGHRVRFVAQREIPPSTKITGGTGMYLIECIHVKPVGATETKVVCTTGSRENDEALCLSRYVDPSAAQISGACTREVTKIWNFLDSDDVKYRLEVGADSIMKNGVPLVNDGKSLTVTAGDVFEWQSYTVGSGRSYHVYAFFDPSEVDDGTQNPANKGQRIETNDSALKIGTQTYTPGKTRTVAELVHNDPFGRIFDALTLEPLDKGRVHLYQQKVPGGPFIEHGQSSVPNVYVTGEDGVFAFAVLDGIYRLDVTKLVTGGGGDHDVPHPDTGLIAKPGSSGSIVEKAIANIKGYDPTTKQVQAQLDGETVVLYTDIYPAQAIFPDVIEDVAGTGKMTHLDIPVKTGELSSALQLVSVEMVADQDAGTFSFSGRATHPFTVVKPYVTQIGGNPETKRYLNLAQPIVSDNLGVFNFTILNDDYNIQTEQIGGVDLVKSAIFTSAPVGAGQGKTNVAAAPQTVTVPIDPVLVHLEGIAYDASGRPLVDGTVGVYINSEEIPYAVATTDTDGYFFIPRYKLPTTTYTIKYLKAGQDVVTLTTSQFLAQNKGYHTDNKVNPYIAAKIPVVESKSQTYQSSNAVPEANIKPVDTITPTPTADPDMASAQNQSTTIVLALVLILVSIASAALAVYYLKKHSSSAKI